jgi:hypothetical protein
MKPAEKIEKLIKNLDLDIDTNAKTDQKILKELIETHEKSKKMKSALIKPNTRRIIMKSPITKLAAAAVIVIAVLIGVDQFDTNSSSVVWADVAERFESVPFFNITIYLCDPSNKTKKIEIWKSEDSRVRAHEGNTVFFADFSKDKNKFVKGIIPLETADTAASKETVLFKAKAKEITPEALKIWALRESKLPIRFFVRPSKGYYDIFFDYSEQKGAAFFDPVAFTNQ